MVRIFGKQRGSGTDEVNIADGQIVTVDPVGLVEPLTRDAGPEIGNQAEEALAGTGGNGHETAWAPAISENPRLSAVRPQADVVPICANWPEPQTPAILLPDVPEVAAPDGPYPRCYLSDGDSGDFAGFDAHLQAAGKTAATRHDYLTVLRRWRKALAPQNNGPDAPDSAADAPGSAPRNGKSIALSIGLLNAIFAAHKPGVALKMKYVLSAYARYRESAGDPRLLYLLTVQKAALDAPTPKAVAPPPRNPTDELSEAEAQQYEHLGRYLIRQGKREGIWLLLSLWGVRPSEVARIEFPNKSNIGFARGTQIVKIKVPAWFMEACRTFPNWRLNRQNIHKRLAALEVSPRALNATAARREQAALLAKLAEQKNIQKMVRQWQRKRPE